MNGVRFEEKSSRSGVNSRARAPNNVGLVLMSHGWRYVDHA